MKELRIAINLWRLKRMMIKSTRLDDKIDALADKILKLENPAN